MATFQAQVTALTTITISSSSTYPTEAQLTQFLTDGAKEVIGILPPKLKMECSTITSLILIFATFGISSIESNNDQIGKVERNYFPRKYSLPKNAAAIYDMYQELKEKVEIFENNFKNNHFSSSLTSSSGFSLSKISIFSSSRVSISE